MNEGCEEKLQKNIFYTVYLIEVVLQTSNFRPLTGIGMKRNFGFDFQMDVSLQTLKKNIAKN